MQTVRAYWSQESLRASFNGPDATVSPSKLGAYALYNLAHSATTTTIAHQGNSNTTSPSKSATTAPTTPGPLDAHPDDCPLCGRRVSAGNSRRHQKTCLGRCLTCKTKGVICDDRDKGAPAHICKSCRQANTQCYYKDPEDGGWKTKGEIGTRTARIVARSGEKAGSGNRGGTKVKVQKTEEGDEEGV
jgi:hypothetical protein